MTYAKRLAGNTAERGNLCVGIDPMPSVLAAWGLEPGVRGLGLLRGPWVEGHRCAGAGARRYP